MIKILLLDSKKDIKLLFESNTNWRENILDIYNEGFNMIESYYSNNKN